VRARRVLEGWYVRFIANPDLVTTGGRPWGSTTVVDNGVNMGVEKQGFDDATFD
jgi:hypothetical protein